MSLSNADVAKVALLARLRLSPDELETFTGQLNSIVDYVAQLQELDTTGVEPLRMGSRCAMFSATTYAGPRSIVKQPWPTPPSGTRRAFWFPPCSNESSGCVQSLATVLAARPSRAGTLTPRVEMRSLDDDK